MTTRLFAAGFAGALIAASIIYLTPLKWITIIEPTIKDVDPTEFYAAFKKDPQQFLFVDVRPPNEYKMIHAVGSINIPLVDLYDAHWSLPKHGKEIVLICTIGRSSGIAYSYLQHYGFFNVERVSGGMVNWVARGLPVEGSAVDAWKSDSHDNQSLGNETSRLSAAVELYRCPSLSA